MTSKVWLNTSLDRKRDRHVNRRHLKPFCGVDGEGGNIFVVDTRGAIVVRHEFYLLRAGEFVLESSTPNRVVELKAIECLEFLADLPPDRLYVSFAFGYDVTMIIRHLPPNRVNALFEKQKRIIRDADGAETGRYYPVDVREFQIDYIPAKEFKVRRRGGKWIVISDVFTFFQSSFVRALQRFYDDEPENSNARRAIARIAEGKAMRNTFGKVTEYEREYNKLEIVRLELLMEKFREMCTALNIHPTKWQGPGNLVSAVFKREGLPRLKEQNIPANVLLWANAAYYGGRFEVKDYGKILGPVYQYDLNSAYASHYKDLPCLIHGTWKRVKKLPTETDAIYFANIQFAHPEDMEWHTLPVRSDKGTLLFPREGNGWYWCHELRIAKKYGVKMRVKVAWQYEQRCDCRHFDWVYDMYAERDRIGKDTGKGKVMKTVLATIYGKVTQSKGHPVYANPIWAGLIVSYCRARLIDVTLAKNGGADVVMLATDGMFCLRPRDVPISKRLGEWSYSEHSHLFIVQSGVYFTPGDKPKTRGVPQSKVIEYEHAFRRAGHEWIERGDVDDDAPFVEIPLRVFIGASLARARGKPWEAGKWAEITKKVRFDWTTKRCDPVIIDGMVTTRPVQGSPWLESRLRDALVGGPLHPSQVLELEQPDWLDRLLWDGDIK